jgi:hypothetical protein
MASLQRSIGFMKQPVSAQIRKLSAVCGFILLEGPRLLMPAPTPSAVSVFTSYTKSVESRLALQHRSPNTFLVHSFSDPEGTDVRLRNGELLVETLAPSRLDGEGALLHHWRGTAFAPGAKAADFVSLMRDFNSYPQHFSPQVLQARATPQSADRIVAWMRVRQRHGITVVMDTTYNIAFGQLDRQHGYSISQSTRIAEIDSPGTRTERTLTAQEEHGFLWRLNTYWSFEERDGGLYMQIESVSLTRSIPSGLGWMIRPYIESIPRESLQFTLRSARNALCKQQRPMPAAEKETK